MSKFSEVAGVVILYNPKIDYLKNINSYCNKIDKLYIIDNSNILNKEFYNKLLEGLCKNVEYLKQKQNKGIAFGLNLGAKKALSEGYRWILTMDQDSKFENDDLNKMLNYIKNNNTNKLGILSPFYSTSLNLIDHKQNKYPLVTMTSGNLINLDIFKEVGGFEEKLFIDEVDHDYCYKIRKNGYKILQLNNVILNHNLGKNSKQVNFFGKNLLISNHNHIRKYYIIRNKLYTSNKFPQYTNSFFKSLLIEFIKVIFYEKNKFKKILYMLKGIKDYKVNKFGELK